MKFISFECFPLTQRTEFRQNIRLKIGRISVKSAEIRPNFNRIFCRFSAEWFFADFRQKFGRMDSAENRLDFNSAEYRQKKIRLDFNSADNRPIFCRINSVNIRIILQILIIYPNNNKIFPAKFSK